MRTRFIQNEILFYLSDCKWHTTQEVADYVEVSRKTVTRHIKDLSRCYKITTHKGGEDNGVCLLEYVFEGILTAQEVTLIVVSLKKENKTPEIEELLKKFEGMIHSNEK